MFDSLEQQMRKNEDRVSTSQGRMMRYGLYALAGIVVLGGLIASSGESVGDFGGNAEIGSRGTAFAACGTAPATVEP
jgi:hypothetical protein